MPIRAPSLVLRTTRTFNVVAPSVRTVCQSLPPSNTSPESRSPSNDPPGTTPTRRYPPGVAPTICSLRTSNRITNNGRVLSVLRASGRSSIRRGDPISYLQRVRFRRQTSLVASLIIRFARGELVKRALPINGREHSLRLSEG